MRARHDRCRGAHAPIVAASCFPSAGPLPPLKKVETKKEAPPPQPLVLRKAGRRWLAASSFFSALAASEKWSCYEIRCRLALFLVSVFFGSFQKKKKKKIETGARLGVGPAAICASLRGPTRGRGPHATARSFPPHRVGKKRTSRVGERAYDDRRAGDGQKKRKRGKKNPKEKKKGKKKRTHAKGKSGKEKDRVKMGMQRSFSDVHSPFWFVRESRIEGLSVFFHWVFVLVRCRCLCPFALSLAAFFLTCSLSLSFVCCGTRRKKTRGRKGPVRKGRSRVCAHVKRPR